MIKSMLKFKRKLDPPPRLVAYPGYAYRANNAVNSDWILYLSGVVYRIPPEFNVRKRMMIRMLRKFMQVPQSALDCELFRERVAPFLADAQHRLQLQVQVGDETFTLPRKTKRNGRFEYKLRVPAAAVRELQYGNIPRIDATFSALRSVDESVTTEVYLQERDGLCVISDIDDTIKHSVVADRKELLANTFLRPFRNVPGMSELYQSWAKRGIHFHYVSSSPWQLFESLRELQGEGGFPDGMLHLRNFRLRDQILKRVRIVRRTGKAVAIMKLMKSLPHRRFLMIGDSGEKDPEIYARACREFPDQVVGVFIRELAARPLDAGRLERFSENLGIPFERYETAGELESMTADLTQHHATVAI